MLFPIFSRIIIFITMINFVFAGFVCRRPDNSCVSGLQRCCSVSKFRCNLFGQACESCHSEENCRKTCKDVGGSFEKYPDHSINRFCKSFRGY